MALVDPVKIYAAASNEEARMICQLLAEAGVTAHAGEDTPPAGGWLGGSAPGVADAGVYVSRADADRAVELIRRQERIEATRHLAAGPDIQAVCEDCGESATFPGDQLGTVQECPHCGSFVDVGEQDDHDEWSEADAEENPEEDC